MPETYVLNPILHKQGGRDNPYEKYHLTEAQWDSATREADSTQDGLAPAASMEYMDYVEPPLESNSEGTLGMRAVDGSYFYLCIAADTWRRIALSSF